MLASSKLSSHKRMEERKLLTSGTWLWQLYKSDWGMKPHVHVTFMMCILKQQHFRNEMRKDEISALYSHFSIYKCTVLNFYSLTP